FGDHPDDLTAGKQRPCGDRAHQPELAAAVDHADALARERVADLHRQFFVARVLGTRRAAVDRHAPDRTGHWARSPSISPAVALALPTTPGMPAPGWVPAPTR